MQRGLVFKGIIFLTLVPALIILFVPISLFLYNVDFLTVLVLMLYSLLLFFGILLRKNAYTDSEVLELVKIPNAPEEIVNMLKTTNIRNRLVNVSLISILGRRKKLSQTELVKYVNKSGVKLSHPAVVKYISDLVELGIFDCQKGIHNARTLEYVLSDKGKWCYIAIKKCFPKRFFFFVIRQYLGIRNLPEFPKNLNIH